MTKLSTQRQGQQLTHVIGLLTRCLEISHRGASLRTAWERDLLAARRDLEALHAGGLPRDPARNPAVAAPALRVGRRGTAAPPVEASAEAPARERGGLEPWQQELTVRLERGLGRQLKPADRECIAWNLPAGTMSVVARPLLGELRANNLTSNIFRRHAAKSAARHAAPLAADGRPAGSPA